MGDLAEKRVHDRRTASQRVFAGTGIGVAVVETAGDSIGRFRLACECDARDLAGGGGWVVVATPEDVLACEVGRTGDVGEGRHVDGGRDDDGGSEGDGDGEHGAAEEGEWIETDFGPAVAVGVDEGDLLAAGPDGELGRVVDAGADPTDWLSVADVDGAVRAIDGPLVGASDGVYRFTADGIFDVGLDDVRDVSAAGVPLAATGQGLFRLANGWLRELDGDVDVVAGTDRPPSDGAPVDGEPDGRDRDDPQPNHDDVVDDDAVDREAVDQGATGTDATAGRRTAADRASDDGVLARGHAATGDTLYEYHGVYTRDREQRDDADGATGDATDRRAAARGSSAAGSEPDGFDGEIRSAAVAAQVWRERPTPVGPVVAVAHGQRTYALTADGTFLLDRGDEWATQALGLPDAVALATPE